MSVIYLLIPLALLLAGIAVWAFVRSAMQGQYDDLDTPAHRMLLDDDGTKRQDSAAERPRNRP